MEKNFHCFFFVFDAEKKTKQKETKSLCNSFKFCVFFFSSVFYVAYKTIMEKKKRWNERKVVFIRTYLCEMYVRVNEMEIGASEWVNVFHLVCTRQGVRVLVSELNNSGHITRNVCAHRVKPTHTHSRTCAVS